MDRTPIVAILGHVDHGKTTILDKIRGANVTAKEAGGITQKISAFTIDKNGKKITFIDTPGHEAFDLMRLRGGNIADIVLLIVAADDGLMPQTEESIEVIKNSSAKPIVVINKVDLPEVKANIEKIKRDINNKGILLEGLGGNVPVALVSGKTGEGIDALLDMINLVAEVEGLQTRKDLMEGVTGKAVVLETIKDKSKGLVSSVVLLQGTLNIGQWITYMSHNEVVLEKVKGIITEENQNMELLNAGYGGRILGLSKTMEPGSEVFVIKDKDEKLASKILTAAQVEENDGAINKEEAMTADNFASFFGGSIDLNDKGNLKVIIKTSSEGALEALKKSVDKLEYEGLKVNIISSGIGDISASDIEQASVSKAIVLGFEVSIEQGVTDLALMRKVLVRRYDIIYKLIDEIKEVLEHLGEPAETEEEIGSASLRAVFTLSDGSLVLGCRVEKGLFKKGCKIYVVRGDDIIGEARIITMRHEKSIINEAKTGEDFGVIIDKKIEAVIGDTLYCYKIMK